MLLLIGILFHSLLAHAFQCHWPNGTADTSGLYKPCRTDRESMCCRTADDKPDHCLDNGLCVNEFWNGNIWRESCTDPTWKSEGCLKLCIEGVVQTEQGPAEMRDSHVLLTTCDNGSFCCGIKPDARECCRNGQGKFIVDGKIVATTTSTTITTSQSSTPTASERILPGEKSSSSNAGTIAGATVGGIGGLALLGGLVWYLMRRRAVAYVTEPQMDKTYYQYHYREVGGDASVQSPPVELAGNMGSEMPAPEPCRELPA